MASGADGPTRSRNSSFDVAAAAGGFTGVFVEEEGGAGGLATVRLACGEATAQVYLFGATLTSWKPSRDGPERIYVSSDAVEELYGGSTLIWGICPIMLFWVTRIWFLARRGIMTDDPVLFAATDRTSYLAGAAIAAVGVLAALR